MENLADQRKMKDQFMANGEHSPLTPEQRENFEGLKYFEEDPSSPFYFQTIRGRGYRFVRDENKKKEAAQNPV